MLANFDLLKRRYPMKIARIIGIALSVILVFALAISITSCKNNNQNEPGPDPTPTEKDITGITFPNETHVYDGREYTLLISGTLPEGVTAAYTNNVGTDAGEYNATVTLSGEGYKTLTLSARLKIEKANIEGVSVSDLTATYDGTEKTVELSGNLPEGVEMTVEGNKATNAGQYTATFTLSGKNYNTKVLTASLLINKADITGITLPSLTVTHDGETKSISIIGTLPEGVTIEYTGNDVSEVGNHPVTAIISGANYNTLELNSFIVIEEAPIPEDQDIEGITFEGATFTYDGEAKSLFITGTLPEGVTVEYNGNGKIDAGKYTVSAVLSGQGYKTLILEADLVINKAVITDISLENAVFTYQENVYHKITIIGTLPEGVTVEYTGNGVTNVGTYTVTATISGANYETLVLTATLEVRGTTGGGVLTPEHPF